MKKRCVLVAGGAGYIGAHTCMALKRAGILPVVLDNLTTGHRSFVKWGPFIEGDIRDAALVERVIREHGIDAVLHFAAHAYVGESVIAPAKYYDNNVVGSLSLLNAMVSTQCRKMVFSSTCAIYGEPATIPITETTDARPINPYGASKLMVEQILRDYRVAYNFEATSLRYFNACGADFECQVGEDRNPETHLIPRAMMSLLGHLDDFEVFGTDYDTPDGTAVRDYIHVIDLADAHVEAVCRLLDGQGGVAVNLGTGSGYSVKQVLEAIRTETGLALPPIAGARRRGDPAVLVAGVTEAQMRLGFRPKYSDLQTIVKTAWAWHRTTHRAVDQTCASSTQQQSSSQLSQ